jgi:hypothetical protein
MWHYLANEKNTQPMSYVRAETTARKEEQKKMEKTNGVDVDEEIKRVEETRSSTVGIRLRGNKSKKEEQERDNQKFYTVERR